MTVQHHSRHIHSTSFKTTKIFVVLDKTHIHIQTQNKKELLASDMVREWHMALKQAMLLCAENCAVPGKPDASETHTKLWLALQ